MTLELPKRIAGKTVRERTTPCVPFAHQLAMNCTAGPLGTAAEPVTVKAGVLLEEDVALSKPRVSPRVRVPDSSVLRP